MFGAELHTSIHRGPGFAKVGKINFSQSLNFWNLAWSYMWHKGFSVGNGGIIVVLLFLGLKRFDGIILEVE